MRRISNLLKFTINIILKGTIRKIVQIGSTMENKIKWATLGLLISCIGQANAGAMGDVSQDFNVVVPNTPSANEFSASALFLRPGGSNDYATLVSPFNANVATPILSPDWQPEGINPDYSAGFSLNFRHLFANSGTDINFYWARLRTKDDSTFFVNRQPPPAQQMTGPVWDLGPNAGPTSHADGRLETNYDLFNAEVGKAIHFAPNLNTRIFAGVSGLWLKQQTDGVFNGVDPILGFYRFDVVTSSQYNAAGIRVGIDGEYQGFYNINPVGLLAGALYIGSLQPSTDTYGTGSILATAGIPVNHQWISHKSYIQAVPAIEAKLGLKYSRQYHEKILAVEGGYQASVYVNAIQNYIPSTFVPGSLGIVSGSVFLQSLLKTTDSFSLDGPYVTASLKM